MGEFQGFPPVTFAFLEGLRDHNDKPWFDAHRADYQAGYVEPALAFIEALGPRLRAFAPELNYEARINGSLFRIQRDTRFAKDKTPYKAYLDLWFWAGPIRGWEAPGCFFRLTPESLVLGAGLHRFSPHQATAYRKAIDDPDSGPELEALLASIATVGAYAVAQPKRKTVPRGFDPCHPRAALLRMEALHGVWEGPVPEVARSAGFLDFCATHCEALHPVNRWLLAHL